VTVRFVVPGKYGYEIQISTDDRMTWKTAVAGSVEATGSAVTISLPAGTRTSGIRIVLDTLPPGAVAGLAEVAVRGARAR
jgi:hypothetical protein